MVPERLDGRLAVGPLQSLAGARPNDDVTVTVEEVQERRVVSVIVRRAPGAANVSE